jgi:hypothetical protein
LMRIPMRKTTKSPSIFAAIRSSLMLFIKVCLLPETRRLNYRLPVWRAIKKPTGVGQHIRNSVYGFLRRKHPRPAKPSPRRAMVAGVGTSDGSGCEKKSLVNVAVTSGEVNVRSG